MIHKSKPVIDLDLVLTEDDLESIKEAEIDLQKDRTKRFKYCY